MLLNHANSSSYVSGLSFVGVILIKDYSFLCWSSSLVAEVGLNLIQ